MGKKIKKIPTFITRDTLRREVEKKTEEAVTVLYDNKGFPSYMLVIPRFRVEDIDPRLGSGVHPAFICNGAEKDKIFIGQFPAAFNKGRAVSLPAFDPQYSINFDESRAACAVKGKGWHLLNSWEWAALSFYITKKNLEKYFVRDWWEWTDGLKILDGQLYFPSFNDIDVSEESWTAQGVFFDDLNNEIPFLSTEINHYTEYNPMGKADTRNGDYTRIGRYKDLELSNSYKSLPEEKRQRMAQMMIEPSKIHNEVLGDLWVRNYGERLPIRGGYWFTGASAGLGALLLNDVRSFVNNGLGCRPAFIE